MARLGGTSRPLEGALALAIFVAFWGAEHTSGVTGLKCHQCGWDSCGTNEELVECTLDRVNQVHGHLQRLVNLTQFDEIPSGSEFVCFELRLTNSYGNRSGTIKSCTIQAAKMCDKTDWQTVKVVSCKTCNDRDYCNGFELPDRDVSGIGFSFSSPSRSSRSSAPSTAHFHRSRPGLWTVALAVTIASCMHKLFANRL